MKPNAELSLENLFLTIKLMGAGIIAFVGLPAALSIALMAPRMEKIYEDMLGSTFKLPGLTKLVMWNPSLTGGALLLTCVLFIFLTLTTRHPRRLGIYVVLGILSTVLLGSLSKVALWLPLFEIVKQMA